MTASQKLVMAGSYYHPRLENTGGGGATGPVAELSRPRSWEEQHAGLHFHGACPMGPGQEALRGPGPGLAHLESLAHRAAFCACMAHCGWVLSSRVC